MTSRALRGFGLLLALSQGFRSPAADSTPGWYLTSATSFPLPRGMWPDRRDGEAVPWLGSRSRPVVGSTIAAVGRDLERSPGPRARIRQHELGRLRSFLHLLLRGRLPCPPRSLAS